MLILNEFVVFFFKQKRKLYSLYGYKIVCMCALFLNTKKKTNE